MKPVRIVCLLASSCMLGLSALAETAPQDPVLIGATAILEMLADKGHKAAPALSPTEQKRNQYREQLKEYAAQRRTLAPDVAADTWLGLFDQFGELPAASRRTGYYYSSGGGYDLDSPDTPLSMQQVIAHLPPPASWPDLLTRVKRRGDPDSVNAIALSVIVHFINGDIAGADTALDRIDALKLKRNVVRNLRHQIQSLRKSLRTMSIESGDDLLRQYRSMLDIRKQSSDDKSTSVDQISIPNLLALTDASDAKALILETFKLSGVSVRIPSGGKTLALAKKIAQEHIEELKTPQWNLITSGEDVTLFEAMQKQFPAKTTANEAMDTAVDLFSSRSNYASHNPHEYQRRSAARWQLLGLIRRDAVDQAVELVLSTPAEEQPRYGYRSRKGGGGSREFAAKMCRFYVAILRADPTRNYWGDYVAAARSAESTPESLTFIEDVLGAADLSPKARVPVLMAKANALLGIDKVDDAIQIYRDLLSQVKPSKVETWQTEVKDELSICMQRMLKIGTITEDVALVDESIALGIQLKAAFGDSDEYSYREMLPFNDLLDAGRYSLLERITRGKIKKILSAQRSQRSARSYAGMNSNLAEPLSKLVQIYSRAGRHEDVIMLMEKADCWGTADLLGLMHQNCVVPLAAALVDVGRHQEAQKILKHFILERPSVDDAYELLLRTPRDGLIRWLEETVYTRDRFEERPLIWKAQLQLELGNLVDAEETVRLAMKIDPTDGEQPAGDRVRAYAVLAEILAAREKPKDAQFFRDVVKSVRLAETGDDMVDAGLITRSIALYEEAETLFGDAYCVQWRLAERLHDLGRTEEARKHYEIAFERMPEQFGRVASFCFGCAGVFTREHSRSVAEDVLMRLSKTMQRPQVFFLLGQLREAQERYEDAYAHFQHAVELDPEYLDAWEKLAGLQDSLFVPQSEQDAMTLSMLRMDPLQRQISGNLKSVANLAALWPVLEENKARFTIKAPESLFSLKASAAAIEAKKAKQSQDAFNTFSQHSYNPYRRNVQTVESLLVGHEVISACIQLLSQTGGSMGMMPF